MNDTIVLLILALVILAFFVWIGVRHNREDRELKQKLGESLGLRPLTQITGELTRQITSVHRQSQSQSLALRNVFSGTLPEGELYLFDLWVSRSGYRGYLEQCAFAAISPRRNLPRITLFPRSSVPGRPGGPLSPLINWAKSPLETEMHLGNPGFEERYLLTGEDESAVRAVLEPEIVDFLVKSPPLLLRAHEHIFTVSDIDINSGKKKPDPETLRALYNQAIRISSLLFS